MEHRNVLRFLGFLLLFAGCCIPAHAQVAHLGLSGGIASYRGDLSSNQDFLYLGPLGPSAGVQARFHFNRVWHTRLGLHFGQVKAADANSSLAEYRERNLSFQSDILEFSLIQEINLFGFHPAQDRWSPYVFGGIAVFRFNPKTEYLGKTYALQPLGTEGQGIEGYPEKYALLQPSVPLGVGLKVALQPNLTLALELGGRKLFTDYLDDVSSQYVANETLLNNNGTLAAILGNRTGEVLGSEPVDKTGQPRGNADRSDWYYFSTASLIFHLGKNGYRTTSRRKGDWGCPKF